MNLPVTENPLRLAALWAGLAGALACAVAAPKQVGLPEVQMRFQSASAADRVAALQAATLLAGELPSAAEAHTCVTLVLDALEDADAFVARQAKMALSMLLWPDARWRTQELVIRELARRLQEPAGSNRVAWALGMWGESAIRRLEFVEAFPAIARPVIHAVRRAGEERNRPAEARPAAVGEAAPPPVWTNLAEAVLRASPRGLRFPRELPPECARSALWDRNPLQRALAVEWVGESWNRFLEQGQQPPCLLRITALMREPSPLVRCSATVAVGTLLQNARADPRLWQRLREQVSDPWPQVSFAALWAMAAHLGMRQRPQEAPVAGLEAAFRSPDPKLRSRALRGWGWPWWGGQSLLRIPPPFITHGSGLTTWWARELMRLYADPEPWIRARAASIHARLLEPFGSAPPEWEPPLAALTRLVTDASPEVRAAGMALLSPGLRRRNAPDRTAKLKLLSQGLADPDLRVRLAAKKTLSRIAGHLAPEDPASARLVAYIAAALNNDHPASVQRACQAAANLPPTLLDDSARDEAAARLTRRILQQPGGFAPAQDVSDLVRLILAQSSPPVTRDLTKRLIAGLEQATPRGTTNACYALAQVMNRCPDPGVQKLCGETLLGFMADEAQPAFRALAVRIVTWGPVGTRQSSAPLDASLQQRLLARLRDCLEDTDPAIQAGAAGSLMVLCGERGWKPPLRQALNTLRTSIQPTSLWLIQVSHLLRLARSPEARVRATAVETARALAQHPEEPIRRRAQLVVDWIERRRR